MKKQILFKYLDINFYSFKLLNIFWAPRIDIKAVIENVIYCPISPSL